MPSSVSFPMAVELVRNAIFPVSQRLLWICQHLITESSVRRRTDKLTNLRTALGWYTVESWARLCKLVGLGHANKVAACLLKLLVSPRLNLLLGEIVSEI